MFIEVQGEPVRIGMHPGIYARLIQVLERLSDYAETEGDRDWAGRFVAALRPTEEGEPE